MKNIKYTYKMCVYTHTYTCIYTYTHTYVHTLYIFIFTFFPLMLNILNKCRANKTHEHLWAKFGPTVHLAVSREETEVLRG